MLAAVGTILSMAKLRATPGKPTASTVETVNVLNGSKKDVGTSFMRRRSEQPAKPHDVQETQEISTRTSPRKRRDPSATVAGPSKLRRVTYAGDPRLEGAATRTSIPQQRSSTYSVKAGRGRNVYDPPDLNEEGQAAAAVTAPAPRRQINMTRRGAKDPFQGHQEVDLPDSSPSKGTRSHDKARKITTSRRKDPRGTLQAPNGKRLTNIMARAAKQVAEAESVVPEELEASIGPRRGRPSKGAEHRLGKQPTLGNVLPTSTSRTQPIGDQRDTVDEEAQESADELLSEVVPDPPRKSQRETANAEMEAEVISGVEEAVSLHDCTIAWTKVLVYAKKAVQSRSLVKSRKINDVLNAIKGIKVAYMKIYHNEMPEGDLHEAETEIKIGTERLKDLLVKIAAADAKEHDLVFVEYIHEQVVPRMSLLLRAVLAARFNEEEQNISIDSLEELMGLIDVTLAFRDLAETAQSRPKQLMNGKGELILGLAASAIGSLKSIKKKYYKTISDHRIAVERANEARRREIDIAREAERAVATQRQRLHERAESYQKKLLEEREKNVEAARNLAARHAEEQRQWKQALISNRSIEAERLRKKLKLPYRPIAACDVALEVQDTIIDIDEFDIDDNSEPVTSRPNQLRPNGFYHSRPRLRREPTEEIPAPVVEPKWTDEQMHALIWGLKSFRGQDRYQNILQSPDVLGILDGKNDFDLMQQALYVKQSMARAMDTGAMPNGTPLEDDWSWLRSV